MPALSVKLVVVAAKIALNPLRVIEEEPKLSVRVLLLDEKIVLAVKLKLLVVNVPAVSVKVLLLIVTASAKDSVQEVLLTAMEKVSALPAVVRVEVTGAMKVTAEKPEIVIPDPSV